MPKLMASQGWGIDLSPWQTWGFLDLPTAF
jgi:hypothetical protein